MVESTRQVRTSDPFDRFDEAINDPGLYPAYQYERPESKQLEPLPQDRVPLFLSDYEQQYEQQQRYEDETPGYTFGSKRDKPRISRVVTGVVAATAAAAAVGFFAMDTTRSVFVDAKASLASLAPASLGGGAPPEAAPPRVVQTAAPEPRIAAPEAQAVYRGRPAEASAAAPAAPAVVAPAAPAAAAAVVARPADQAYAMVPSRQDISAAYQSAIKGPVAALAPAAAPAAPAPQVRRIDPDELATLLTRAKSLLAVGDIASARLLLERAADAHEAEAALMLGTTYDPQVLGNQDMRSITPDPAKARHWYQKAATFGSADARRRLSQIQN